MLKLTVITLKLSNELRRSIMDQSSLGTGRVCLDLEDLG
jgi:hypothetical protein